MGTSHSLRIVCNGASFSAMNPEKIKLCVWARLAFDTAHERVMLRD